MASPTETMTPEAAVRTLRELGVYEERLTMRTAGITWMVWALAVPGIFLTYGTASDWIEANGIEWLFGLLWAPWIVLASTATGALWKSHAVALQREERGPSGWLVSLGYTAMFFAIAGALFFLTRDVIVMTRMTITVGLFTIAMGVIQRRAWDGGSIVAMIGGALIALAGGALALTDLTPVPAGLLGAATCGGVYFVMGLLLYRRG